MQTHVEVYLDDTLLGRREEAPGRCVVFDHVFPLATEDVSLCVAENGELRDLSLSCSSPNGSGIGDASCEPWCYPHLEQDQCGDEKCGLRVKLADPYYAHVACVPIGAQQVGQPCAIDADGHDDCAEGAGCYAGQCRVWCSMQTGGCGAQTCTALPRITDGFGVCM